MKKRFRVDFQKRDERRLHVPGPCIQNVDAKVNVSSHCTSTVRIPISRPSALQRDPAMFS